MDIILSGKLFKKVEEHLEATKANREMNENLPNSSQVRLILNTPESNNKIVRQTLGKDGEFQPNTFALLCAFEGYNPESMNFDGSAISDLIFEYLVGIDASPNVVLLVQKSGISEKEIDILNSTAHRTKSSFEEILKLYLENMSHIQDANLNSSNEIEIRIKRLAACSKGENARESLIHLASTNAPASKVSIFEDIHSALYRGMITPKQYKTLARKIDEPELAICRAFNKCFGA